MLITKFCAQGRHKVRKGCFFCQWHGLASVLAHLAWLQCYRLKTLSLTNRSSCLPVLSRPLCTCPPFHTQTHLPLPAPSGRFQCLQVAKQTWAAQSKAKKGAWWAKKVNQFASNSGKYNSWEAWLAGHTGACTEAKLTANKCYSDVYEKLPKQSNPFDTECRAITCA